MLPLPWVRGCEAWRGEPGNGALELVESRATPKGVTIQIYRPTGRPQYETATPDLNT